MKCDVCEQEFDQSNLAEVFKHEHGDLVTIPNNQGRLVGKTYTEEKSVNIKEIRYEYDEHSLIVTYRNGKKYEYFDVPELVFRQACETDSIGAFPANIIKGNYRYACINGD